MIQKSIRHSEFLLVKPKQKAKGQRTMETTEEEFTKTETEQVNTDRIKDSGKAQQESRTKEFEEYLMDIGLRF